MLDHIYEVDCALLRAEHYPVAAADTSLEVVLIGQDGLNADSGGVDPLDEGQNHPVA